MRSSRTEDASLEDGEVAALAEENEVLPEPLVYAAIATGGTNNNSLVTAPLRSATSLLRPVTAPLLSVTSLLRPVTALLRPVTARFRSVTAPLRSVTALLRPMNVPLRSVTTLFRRRRRAATHLASLSGFFGNLNRCFLIRDYTRQLPSAHLSLHCFKKSSTPFLVYVWPMFHNYSAANSAVRHWAKHFDKLHHRLSDQQNGQDVGHSKLDIVHNFRHLQIVWSMSS